MNTHLHKYKIDCKSSNLHGHRIMGHTDNMIGVNSFHFHYFSGISSYNGHTHYYSGFTGMPIKTENGHIHKLETVLEQNNQHEHEVESFTFEEVEYINNKYYKEAYNI